MQTIRKQLADRIRAYDDAQSKALFVEVADSGQLDEVMRNLNTTEGCYVIKLEREAGTESDFYQSVTERYQVVTICQNLADAYGGAVGDVAEAMQECVFKSLSGFIAKDSVNKDTDPLLFVTGGLVDLKNNLHVWADIYQLEFTQNINQQ